jgi:hypothetical protein
VAFPTAQLVLQSSSQRTRKSEKHRVMRFRFRRTFRIAPGLRLNLSKSGVSGVAGRSGAWFAIGHGKQQGIGASPGDDAALPATSGGGWAR